MKENKTIIIIIIITDVEDDGDKLSCLGSQVEVDTNNRVANVDEVDNRSENWSDNETMNTEIHNRVDNVEGADNSLENWSDNENETMNMGILKRMFTYYYYM